MSLSIEKCLQAWTNSLRQMRAKADVVFFGDSLTYYGDFSSCFPNKVVCNLGLRGDTIQGMIERVGQVRMLEPQKVYLMAGLNDVASCDLWEFGRRFEDLVCLLMSQTDGAEVVVQSLLPVNEKDFSISCNNNQIKACNEVIAVIAKSHSLRFLDLFTCYEQEGALPKVATNDGLHLKQDVYFKWYDIIRFD